MAKGTIIKTPARYITPDLIHGEEAVIHIISPKQHFLNLKFEEDNKSVNGVCYKPILSIDNIGKASIKEGLREEVAKIEDRIIDLGSLYTIYNYLFTLKNDEIYLVSTTLQGTSLGYDITREIAEEIGVPHIKPVWTGTLCQHVINAFIEPVFIQKK
jgi:hypothetical protein